MAELLYWIALDCRGVPNKVFGEYISRLMGFDITKQTNS